MRFASAALALALALIVCGAGSALPELSLESAVDLSEAEWSFLPQLGAADRLILQVQGEVVEPWPVALPGTVESTGGRGWLRTAVRVADVGPRLEPLLSTELVIGDVRGTDEVRFNGQPIGTSSGMAISETGVPRRYVVPSRAIRFGGVNEIAVRVVALGGGSEIRVGGPITLAALGPHALWEGCSDARSSLQRSAQAAWACEVEGVGESAAIERVWTQHREILMQIVGAEASLAAGNLGNADQALGDVQVQLRSLSAAAGSLRLTAESARSRRGEGLLRFVESALSAEQRARGLEPRLFDGGFGRFGFWHADGTPYLTRVTPTGFRGHGAMDWSVVIDDLHALEVVDVSWIGKTTLVTGERDGRACDHTLSVSLPFPGVMLEQRAGRDLAFDLGARFSEVSLTAMPVLRDGQIMHPPLGEADALLVRHVSEDETMWLIRSAQPFERAELSTASADTTRLHLRLRSGAARRVIIAPVHGIDLVDTGRIDAEACAAMSRVAAVMDQFPLRVDEIYLVDPAEERVTLFDHFVSRPLGGAAESLDEGSVVWVPPLARFCAEQMNQEAAFDWGETLELPTVSTHGPAAAARHPMGMAVWSLPLPSTDGRFHVRPAASADVVAMLNEHLTDLGSPTMINAVDRTYKSRAQGYHAWALLTEENRRRLTANGQQMIPLTFDPGIWHEVVEPFTGTPTWYTYTIEGPAFDLYDQDWSNGLPLYALSLWAMVENEWSALADHREAMDRMWAWWPETEDWAWMRCANAFHGHGTGAGDCSCAAYVGALGRARIMEALGDAAARDEALLLLARSAVSITGRFGLTHWARERGLIGPSDVAIGFHEGEGFLHDAVGNHPWNVTSMISGNGVQPEIHSLLIDRVPDLFARFEEEILEANPTIFEGELDHGPPTLYRGNSGYITLPHLAAQARLGAPMEQLRPWLNSARPNGHLWWIAPTVLAEVAAHDTGFTLARWDAARFEGGEVDSEGAIHVRFTTDVAPFRWEADSLHRPERVEVNGTDVSRWSWDERTGRLRVETTLVGSLEFTVVMP